MSIYKKIGGGNEKHLYLHNIYIRDAADRQTIIQLFLDNNEKITSTRQIATYLYNNGFNTYYKSYLINAPYRGEESTYIGMYASGTGDESDLFDNLYLVVGTNDYESGFDADPEINDIIVQLL